MRLPKAPAARPAARAGEVRVNECPICYTYHNVGDPCMFTYTATRGAVQIAGQAVSAERARCARIARQAYVDWRDLQQRQASVACETGLDYICQEIAVAIERGEESVNPERFCFAGGRGRIPSGVTE